MANVLPTEGELRNRARVREEITRLQDKLKELAPAYEKAAKEPPITGKTKELIDMLTNYAPEPAALFTLGQATVLAHQIDEAAMTVSEFKAVEKRIVEASDALERAEHTGAEVSDVMVAMGKPVQ